MFARTETRRGHVGRRLMSGLVAILGMAFASLAIITTTAPAAQADACYTWNSTMSESRNSSGSAVKQLQIRVAGWVGYGEVLSIDGDYGPKTTAAVKRFQRAYGLTADGVAGPNTYSKLYALQDSDCSPAHFDWSEVNNARSCGYGSYSGGSVSSTTVKSNLLKAMWRAEALRKQLGGHPLIVTSGFRSYNCDRQVGGSGYGQHTYGRAMDLVPANSRTSFCSISKQARYHGFNAIFGPGYPAHDDHVHVDIRSARKWSAPTCGI